MLSASIAALALSFQMGSPASADITPTDALINDLLLLDCHLLANERAKMLQMLEENDDLLRLIELRLPECLELVGTDSDEGSSERLQNFGVRRSSFEREDDDDSDDSDNQY